MPQTIYIKDYDTEVTIPDGSDMKQVQAALQKRFPDKNNKIERSIPQRIAGAVAPYARPVLEYGGAMAGGALGTAGEPGLGTLLGAGLGYAAGRQGANALEEYAGMKQPSTILQAAKEAVIDVGTGATMEAGGQVLGAGVKAASPYITKAAQRLYGSATKMPLSKKWVQTMSESGVSDRVKAIKQGLEDKVYSSEYGIAKTKMLEQQAKNAVDDVVNAGAASGETARTEDIIQKGLSKAYARAAKSSDPIGAQKIVDEVAEKFRAHGDVIKLDDLNAIKRQLYDEVKWGGSEQTALVGQLTTMGKKGMAKAAKEYMEQLHPELKMMNQKDSAYIKLQEAIERTVGREQNKDLVGLAAKALSVRSIPAAIFESTLGHPYVKETLAFALNKAGRYGAPTISRAIAYPIGQAIGQSGMQQGMNQLPPMVGNAQAATLADYARGGDNPRARALQDAAEGPQAAPAPQMAPQPATQAPRPSMTPQQMAAFNAETEKLRQKFESQRNEPQQRTKKKINVRRVTIHNPDGDEMKYMDDKGKLYDEDPNEE
jgi:hypothetical protein